MSEALNRKLQAIAVRTVASSGNVAPILHEIRHALFDLAQSGATRIIDLKSMPLAPGEQERILEVLGEGELRIELVSLGRSDICETGYPGVWVVTHYDEDGELKARFIEISRIPDIVMSQQGDINDGLDRLQQTLRTLSA